MEQHVASKPIPPPPEEPVQPLPPPQGPLDDRSVRHLQAHIDQALLEAGFDRDAIQDWEPQLLDLAVDLAGDVPYVAEILEEQGNNDAHIKRSDEKRDGDGDSADTSSRQSRDQPHHHSIQVRIEPPIPNSDSCIIRYVRDSSPGSAHSGLIRLVVLKGPSMEDLKKIEKIIHFLMYAVTSVKLEMHLFLDSLIHAPKSLTNSTNSNGYESVGKSSNEALSPARKGEDLKSILWSWLPSRTSRLAIPPIFYDASDVVNPSSPSKDSTSRVEHMFSRSKSSLANSSAASANGLSSFRAPSSRPSSAKSSLKPTSSMDQIVDMLNKTVISTSPGVKFPPPHLLLRLRDEETCLSSISSPSTQPPRKFSRKISYGANDANFFKTILQTASQPITPDSKAGLGYLLPTHGKSLSGIIRHQSISALYVEYADTTGFMCVPPRLVTIQYYNKQGPHRDVTIQEYFETMFKRLETSKCSACPQKLVDHSVLWMHGHTRLQFSFFKSAQSMPTSHTIHLQSSCRICNAHSALVPLSTLSKHVSFGKFLELVCYDKNFVRWGICEHLDGCDPSSQVRNYLRWFRCGSFVAVLETGDVDLYEMRVPGVSIGSELGQEGLQEVNEVQLKEDFRLQVSRFWSSVRENCEEFASKVDTPIATTIKNLDGEIRDHENELYKLLGNTTAYMINFARNEYRRRAVSVIKKLEGILDDKSVRKWLEKQKASMKFSFCMPDYVSDPRAFLFNSSYVVVREDEPTSIIALALSQGDYLDHLKKTTQTDGSDSPLIQEAELNEQWRKVKIFATLDSSSSSTPHPSPIPPRDHIKYKFQEGDIRVSCTLYYARAFEDLRRRFITCYPSNGTEATSTSTATAPNFLHLSYVSSLERCSKWDARGGKTRSAFFKSLDDRLVIKEMQSRWSTDEKNALLRFAPKYFEYMKSTDQHPSILAKIFGFYTVKIKNMKTNQVMKKDLLIMEHLFCGMKISRKFDLKGVLDRKTTSNQAAMGTHSPVRSQITSAMATAPSSSSSSSSSASSNTAVLPPPSETTTSTSTSNSLTAPLRNMSFASSASSLTNVLTAALKSSTSSNTTPATTSASESEDPDTISINSTDDKRPPQRRSRSDAHKRKPSEVLWDGDWVEGKYKTSLLIHSYSKNIILESVNNDTKFLADANIMDYSILVGVNDERKELVVGIVDFIDTYTLLKMIESKGKSTLRGGRNDSVTVCPPEVYAERFRAAMQEYFLVVPDKWLKEVCGSPPWIFTVAKSGGAGDKEKVGLSGGGGGKDKGEEDDDCGGFFGVLPPVL